MSVKAKFRVDSISKYYEGTDNEGRTINMTAVIGTAGDNSDWSKYTTAGQLQMNVTNPSAFEQFKEGGVYYLTFEPVE